MNSLRKIIKEEIERMLSEGVFYDTSQSNVFKTSKSPKEDIISDYDLGYQFASNSLQVDIDSLNRYSLDEYFPESETEEKWSFTFETAVGIILIVDIKREIIDDNSFWSLTFSILNRGKGELPEEKAKIKNIKGYDEFVAVINEQLSEKIDPSEY